MVIGEKRTGGDGRKEKIKRRWKAIEEMRGDEIRSEEKGRRNECR